MVCVWCLHCRHWQSACVTGWQRKVKGRFCVGSAAAGRGKRRSDWAELGSTPLLFHLRGWLEFCAVAASVCVLRAG